MAEKYDDVEVQIRDAKKEDMAAIYEMIQVLQTT